MELMQDAKAEASYSLPLRHWAAFLKPARSTQRQSTGQSAGEEAEQCQHGQQQDAPQDGGQYEVKSQCSHGVGKHSAAPSYPKKKKEKPQLVSNGVRFPSRK